MDLFYDAVTHPQWDPMEWIVGLAVVAAGCLPLWPAPKGALLPEPYSTPSSRRRPRQKVAALRRNAGLSLKAFADRCPWSKGRMDAGAVEAKRLQVELCKWLASQLFPEVYADRVSAEVSGLAGRPFWGVAVVPTPVDWDALIRPITGVSEAGRRRPTPTLIPQPPGKSQPNRRRK